jgi:HAD superfamily hydrolase (TIGR01544 family)
VFSAGIGDIIKETFKLRANLFDNIEVVSNFMDFNEQGDLIGFKGELLHVFNKNENVIHQSDYFDNLSHRHNIILMGDSLGDLGMADGAICDSILRIGFLNGKDIESRLPQYIDAYDIVLVNDQTMSVPNAIIEKIMSTPSSINSIA